MLGLIKKDLLMARGNLKVIITMLVVFTLVSINGNGNFSFIPAFISVMIMMSTFSYDEYNKTDAYISSFPKGRKNAVKSKYLTTLLVVFISIIITFLLSIAVGYAKNSINMEEVLSTTLGCGFAVIVIQSILYPLIYKFGVEKSRIGLFIGAFAITGIASIFLKTGANINIPQNIVNVLNNYYMIIVPVTIILILFVSYEISKIVYLKKEL